MLKSPSTLNVQHARPSVKRRSKRHPPLTREQQRLVAEHAWIAGRLAHRAKGLTGGTTGCLTRDDLEAIANFALCVAATRHDPSKGVKYSTYAWATARGYIQHALRDQSRMVRTPRWVANHKNKVDELLKEGKSYAEIAKELGIDEDRVIMCDMSSYNYHITYDNQPEDWATKEFIYIEDVEYVLSKDLRKAMTSLTDAEISMVLKYVEGESSSEEEREWAADKLWELQSIAYGEQ